MKLFSNLQINAGINLPRVDWGPYFFPKTHPCVHVFPLKPHMTSTCPFPVWCKSFKDKKAWINPCNECLRYLPFAWCRRGPDTGHWGPCEPLSTPPPGSWRAGQVGTGNARSANNSTTHSSKPWSLGCCQRLSLQTSKTVPWKMDILHLFLSEFIIWFNIIF